VVKGLRIDDKSNRANDFLELFLRQFGKEVVKVIRVISCIHSIFEEDPHLLSGIVLIYCSQPIIIYCELIELFVLILIQLTLLRLDCQVGSSAVDVVVIHVIQICSLQVVAADNEVPLIGVCLNERDVKFEQIIDKLAIGQPS
jgi:hypothetical protein